MDLLTPLIALGSASLTGLVVALKWQTKRASGLLKENQALRQELMDLKDARIAELEDHSMTAEALLKQLGVKPSDGA